MGLLTQQKPEQQLVQIVCSNMQQGYSVLRQCLDNTREQLANNKDGMTFEQCLAVLSAEADTEKGTVANGLLEFYRDAVELVNKYAGQAKMGMLADVIPAGVEVEVLSDKTVTIKQKPK